MSYSKADSPAGIYTPTLALVAAQKQRIEKEAKSKPTKLSDTESAEDYFKFWHKNMDKKSNSLGSDSQEKSKGASSSAETDVSSKPPSASV